jgi:phosphoadenosine phosphosulfate reductase
MDCIIRSLSEPAEIPAGLEDAAPEEVLAWAVDSFNEGVSLACSFGAEDVVLLDMLSRIAQRPRAFVLDTGRLHPQTYDVMERCRERYGIEFDVFVPDSVALQDLLREKGPLSFYESIENRKECCGIRKVEPLDRALADRRAWITGQRREQAVTRRYLPVFEQDHAHGGILKINPLARWTDAQLWDYIRSRAVPYNKLHDQGFPSIGCAPCTRAVAQGEDVRSGRWWWESPEHKECGLHSRTQA